MSGGAFQISREIFDNPIWDDIPKFRIFFYILGNAVFSHEGLRVGDITVERGQFLRSLRNLQDDLMYREGRGNTIKKYPLTTIQRKIKSLEKEERITTKSTECGTLFTVVNYHIYQGFERYKKPSMEQQRNSDGTVTEQQWNNNNNVIKEKNVEERKECSSRGQTTQNDIFVFYQKNLQRGVTESPYVYENIEMWIRDMGDDLVLAAMKVAAKEEKKGFNYTEGILKKWLDAGVVDLDSARRFQEEFKNSGKQGYKKQNKSELPLAFQSLQEWAAEKNDRK